MASAGQGNIASITSGSGSAKGGDHKVTGVSDDGDLRAQVALLASRFDQLMATMSLPSPIIATPGGPIATATAPSLIAGIRNAANINSLPISSVKRVANPTTTSVAPSTPMVATASTAPQYTTISDLPHVNELADIGIDGQQDEPSTVARAAALNERLAPLQCRYIDEEYEGSFVKWSKDGKWKDHYGREVKLMARILDALRRGDSDDAMEIACRRLSALDMLNSGHGSAAADAIEGKSRTSITPQQMRIAAVKEGNLMTRTTHGGSISSTGQQNAGQGGKSKGKEKGKAAGSAASQAAVTSGNK